MIDPRSRIRRVLLADDTVADPLDAIALAPGEPAFYWRSDQRDIEIAALGAIATIDADGEERFGEASRAFASLRARIDDVDGCWPLAVGGFAFDDGRPIAPWEGFPALRFFVPRVLWIREGGQRRMIVAYAAAREQTPRELLAGSPFDHARITGVDAVDTAAADDHRTSAANELEACLRSTRPSNVAREEDSVHWSARVAAAVEAIREGRLEKIVLARRRTVDAPATPVSETLVRALAEARPSCFTFLVRWSGRTFLGSSPERLLRLGAGTIEADALAGSAPRGLSRAHDESLSRELLASCKERREHRIVADAIRAALEPLALEVTAASEPSVLTLPEAHHLHTPVTARLDSSCGATLLDIAQRLHPTPAVCGAPRLEACRQLAREEADRGWYGGAVGWIASNGEGELAVALRAALLGESCAHVWAGAGIVEGSSPEHEYDETERKMRSILPYFEAAGDECAA